MVIEVQVCIPYLHQWSQNYSQLFTLLPLPCAAVANMAASGVSPSSHPEVGLILRASFIRVKNT